MRIILFTGKGGVGKTSISAASALRCAQLGYNTVVMSTDAAHSLADSFECELASEPTQIESNLFGLEIDVEAELRRNWGRIQAFIKRNLIRTAKFTDLIAEEFAVFPGMEELFSLLKLKEYYEHNEFDVAIVDCAPTAGTIRMLSFPDIAQWYMEKVFNVERRIMKVVRPVVNPMVEVELPPDEVFGNVEDLYGRMEGMKDILCNAEVSSVRLVMNPEKMVIKESQRAYAYLNLFGYPVDAAVVNRLYPPGVGGDYFRKWEKIQKGYMGEIEAAFHPLPILTAAFMSDEVVGRRPLEAMAEDLYGDSDPSEVFVKEEPLKIHQSDGRYEVVMHLPFTDKEDLDVWIHGDELIVQIKNFKRNIVIPRALANREIREAKFEGNKLRIVFDEKGV